MAGNGIDGEIDVGVREEADAAVGAAARSGQNGISMNGEL
jgi:hypothetical protein